MTTTKTKNAMPNAAQPSQEVIQISILGLSRNHASDYLGAWALYSLSSPIDFGWQLLVPVSTAFSYCDPLGPSDAAEAEEALQLGALLQAVTAWRGMCDVRVLPHLIALPGDNSVVAHGFVWKLENNGETIVLLKEDSMSLMRLIDPYSAEAGPTQMLELVVR